nr:hypothetical protein [Micromonospora sp. DSM 115978]
MSSRKAAGYRQVSFWLCPDDVARVLSLGGSFTGTARRLLLDKLREVELDDE